MAEEIKNAAETNAGAVAPSELNAAPDTTTEENKEGFSGVTEAVGGEGGGNTAPKDKENERNAENARRRRQAEQAERIKNAEINAIKRVLSENPYTHQPIENEADVEEYLIMRKIEEEGGDPTNDYFKYAREQRAGKQKKADDTAKIQRELEDFAAENPDINVSDVLNDPDFNEYAEGKLDKKPLSEVYRDYRRYIGRFSVKAKEDADKRTAQAMANASAAVGSLNNSKPNADDISFTKEQVKAMSKEDIRKNYEKIRESMKKW